MSQRDSSTAASAFTFKHALTADNTRAPKDRMLTNGFFYALGHEVFLVASSFHHKSLSYPHRTARKFEDMK